MNKTKKIPIIILVVVIIAFFLLFSVSARCEAEDLVDMGCSIPASIIGGILAREDGEVLVRDEDWEPMRTEEEWADFYFSECVVPQQLYEAYYAIGALEGEMVGQKLDNPERLFNFPVFNYQASLVFENKSDSEFIVWYFPKNGQHVEFGRWGADYVKPHTKKVIGGYVSYHHSLSQEGDETYSRGIETLLVVYDREHCDPINPFMVYNPDGSQSVEEIPLYKYFVLVPNPEEHYMDLGGGYKTIEKEF